MDFKKEFKTLFRSSQGKTENKKPASTENKEPPTTENKEPPTTENE